MPTGLNDLNSTEAAEALAPTLYARQLADRRETEEIRQLSNFGLVLGWLFTLLGGFFYLCMISRFDGFWSCLMILGLAMILLGTIVPQVLERPHRIWMRIAHWQGRIVMTLLLSVAYFCLIWPLGLWERKRQGGSSPFYSWDASPPSVTTGWQALTEATGVTANRGPSRSKRVSMIWIFFETLAFFTRRGHYLLVPVLILLMLLGLILFFVQSSVLAPFIYTIAVVM